MTWKGRGRTRCWLRVRLEPQLQRCVRKVCGRPVVDVHLIAKSLDWSVDIKSGDRSSSDGPENIGRISLIPCCSFLNNSCALLWSGEICTDPMESLLFGSRPGRLSSPLIANGGIVEMARIPKHLVERFRAF